MGVLENLFRDAVRLLSGPLPESVAVAVVALTSFVGLLWIVELLDFLLARRLDRLGIRPRTGAGLAGVIFAPLLHGGFAHLGANSIPLLVLGTLVAFTDLTNLVLVTVIAWVGSGTGVWLFGRGNSRHLGASGIVFGYLGFLLALAVTRQSALAITLAAVALVLYGGAIWGILPLKRGRSWQGHLFGLVSGILCVVYLLPWRESLEQDAVTAWEFGSPVGNIPLHADFRQAPVYFRQGQKGGGELDPTIPGALRQPDAGIAMAAPA